MCTHRFGGCEEVAHERLLPRRLGTTNLLVAQLLQARLGSDELAIDRFEVGSFSFISRVCVAMAVRNASCTLTDCSCSSATSAVSAELVVLGDVVRCLPRLIALVAQATELLNVVGPSHAPCPGDCSRHGSVDPWDKVTRAFLTFAWHVGHLWWPSRRFFWRFGWQNGMGWAQNSRVFRDAPTVVDFHR